MHQSTETGTPTQTAGDVEKKEKNSTPGAAQAGKSTRFGGEGGGGDVPKLPDLPPEEGGEPQGGSGNNTDKIGGGGVQKVNLKDKIGGDTGTGIGKANLKSNASSSAPGLDQDDEFASLLKRFEALKKR